MVQRTTGHHVPISTVGGEKCQAFVPNTLPPNPPLKISTALQQQLDKALVALGRLDSVSALLPDASIFLYMYVRKEAVLSSQIEGTQSSLSDLLRFESTSSPGVPNDDVGEVSNYVAALDHGLQSLESGLPISLRLIRDAHRVLLQQCRGSEKDPGEFRRSQNWIGGTRPGNATYVPPPPDKVIDCMGDLEKFLHADTPVLIKAALAHVQFESIHPFLDGNGRIGRLLITLILYAQEVLSMPTLYLSLYFKAHRQEYYDLLQRVRQEGDWESWLEFFVAGVIETSEQATQTAKRIADLFEADKKRIESLGRPAGTALRVHRVLQSSPIVGVAKAAEMAGVTIPTSTSAFGHLQKLGIAAELPKSGRSRVYGYTEYIQILNEGTEPL